MILFCGAGGGADLLHWAVTSSRVTAFSKESHLRISSSLVAALGASTLAISVLAAPAPAPTTKPAVPAPKPAAAAASTPAATSAQEEAARGAVRNFFHAMFAGDQTAAFALLTYSDVDAKQQPMAKDKAQTMFGEILAEQRLRQAVTAAFGDKAKTFDVGMSDSDVADFEKEMQTATVKMNGTSANVAMGPGPTYVVVQKDGKWLVDFDKTQANMGPLPEGADLEMLTKKTAGYEQLAKDVAAKKFGSLEEVGKEVDKVDAAAAGKGAETAPASGPATGAGTKP